MKVNQLFILTFLLLAALLVHAQEVKVSNGLTVSSEGPLQLVFTDMGLNNNGNFKSDNGTIIFSGSSTYPRLFINGNAPLSLHHVTIDLPGELQLQNNLLVSGNLKMTQGNIDLNNYSIDLGNTGRVEGESRYSRIMGKNGGFIRATSYLNSPQQLTPGNLGLRLTSNKNLGRTTIVRGHTQQINERGELSIARYYQVEPQFAGDVQAQVVANFIDVEAANVNTNEIGLWSSRDGGYKWTAISRDNNTYYLDETRNTQPLRITYFTGNNNAIAGSYLQLYPNPVNSKFILAFTNPKQQQFAVNLYNDYGQLLESRKVISFNGLNKLEWDVSKYPAGNYQLKFVGADMRNISFTKQ